MADVALPSGEVTFMFTDIEGSTRLFRELGDDYPMLLDRHRAVVRRALKAHSGHEIKTEGDSFFTAFAAAADAVAAAVQIQRDLIAEVWPDGGEVRVRIGVHSGEAAPVDGDYVALAVHRAARVADAGHGGQILLSDATATGVADTLPVDCSLRSLGSYRLRDFEDPAELLQLDGPGLVADHAALRAMRAARHNVPTPTTAFVGRHEERRRITKLLASDPVVTIVAPGGFGKTRLVSEIGVALADEMRDGTAYVALGPLTQDEMVGAAVLEALGGRADPGRDAVSAVADVASGRVGLIVLDEAERVVSGVARVVDSLRSACPDSRILITSRQPVRVTGERVVELDGLALPTVDDDPTLAVSADAVALLLDRLGVDDTVLTESDAEGAVQLCRRLDGLPLAIELAAARVPDLGIGGVVAALVTDTEGDPVTDAIRWSYGLLGPAAKRLFRRLSWLGAEANVATIAAVVAGRNFDDLDPDDVSDLLRVLADRSLLRASRDATGELRYRMLETFREVAEREVASAREQPALDRNLVQWAVTLIGRSSAQRQIDGSPATDYGARLPMFFATLDAGERTGDKRIPLVLLEIAPTLVSHGAWAIVETRAHAALAIEGIPAEPKSALYTFLARAAFVAGDAARAMEWVAKAEGMFPDLPPVHVALLECDLANDLLRIDPFRASRYAEHALPILDQHSPATVIAALHAAGATRMMFGNVAGGREAMERCLELSRRSNDGRAVANALAALGNAAFTVGDFADASRLLNEAVLQFRALRSPTQLGPALAMAGHAAALLGNTDAGIDMLEESLALRLRFNDVIGSLFCKLNLGDVLDRAGRRDDARRSFADAFASCAGAGAVPLQQAAAHGLAVTVRDEHARDGLVVLAAAVQRNVGTMGIDAPVTEAALARLRSLVDDADAAEAEGKALSDEDFLTRAEALGGLA